MDKLMNKERIKRIAINVEVIFVVLVGLYSHYNGEAPLKLICPIGRLLLTLLAAIVAASICAIAHFWGWQHSKDKHDCPLFFIIIASVIILSIGMFSFSMHNIVGKFCQLVCMMSITTFFVDFCKKGIEKLDKRYDDYCKKNK